MRVSKDFELTFTDRDDFEGIIVQIRWGDVVICEINKENGYENSEMEIYCNDEIYNNREIKFSFLDFIEAIRVAEDELRKL